MNFLVGFLRTIILLGAVQGFIISSLLYFSKKSTYSSRLLSKLIFLIALASFKLYGSMQGWFDYSDLTRVLDAILPMIIVMPMGPLIYFYIRSFADSGFKMSKRDRLHFYPIALDLIPQAAAIIYIIALIIKLIPTDYKPFGRSLGMWIDDYNVYADIPRWISISTYLILSARFLTDLGSKSGLVSGQENNLKWLRQFVRVFLIFQIIWFVYLVPYVIPRYTDVMLNTFDWYPIYIPLAVLIYWLGIKGYFMANTYAAASAKKFIGINSTLADEAIDDTVISLRKVMETEKLFLDPGLNLQMLSQRIHISQKIISAVLNQHLHKSFNEFINEYRIEAFKSKLQDPAMDHLTIAGIAFECGFNSQATFQRAFKQLTGLSPTEFRNTSLEIQ